MKSVMYHYVREKKNNSGSLKFLDINNFIQQLDFFNKSGGLPRYDEFEGCIKEKRLTDIHGYILTFDDGLKDHYRYVFPELIKNNNWGIFYIPTAFYKTGKLLDVHKVHLLLSYVTASKALDKLLSLISKKHISEMNYEIYISEAYKNHDDDESRIALKKMLNYLIDFQYRDSIMNELMREYFGCEVESYANDYYLSREEIREMNEYGMIFGSHTVNHYLLSKLKKEEQEYEIKESVSFVEDLLHPNNKHMTTFCYPYGGTKSYNKDTIDILKKSGVQYAFTVENREMCDNDLLNMPYELPRFDCNFFPFGKAEN